MTATQAPQPRISVLTFVLQHHHCALLEDWFDFFDRPVAGLVVHVGEDPRIAATLAAMCAARDIRLTTLGTTTAAETTHAEQALLARQFDALDDGLACVVRLDTLPFRAAGVTWQDETLAAMAAAGACFVTGSTLPFRADRPAGHPRLMLTQRLSNCFMLIAPDTWRRLQQGVPGSDARYGRFAVEGAAEDYLAAHGLWGLRLLNGRDLRIFHCQEWSERIFEVRRNFRAGHRIGPFLTGHQEDLGRAWQKFYMRPGPPPLRRARIVLGAWRRQAMGWLRGRG